MSGGGVANPSQPTTRLQNEAVIGVRANITF
jgi:hypothetical protein